MVHENPSSNLLIKFVFHEVNNINNIRLKLLDIFGWVKRQIFKYLNIFLSLPLHDNLITCPLESVWGYTRQSFLMLHGGWSLCTFSGNSRKISTVNAQIWNKWCKVLFVCSDFSAVSEQYEKLTIQMLLCGS